MGVTLPEQMYATYRAALEDPTSAPAWGNLPTELRRAWETGADISRAIIQAATLDREQALMLARDARIQAEDRGESYRRVVAAMAVVSAQLDAARSAIGAGCVEHVELNGHIDIAEQARDWIAHEANSGGPSERLGEFVESLRVVIDQCDRQRRRANWYEAAHEAGKAKLIESAVAKALSRARAAAQVYVERVEALGLAADDSDPRVMATAGPIGEAQADLYAALGLLERSESGEVAVTPPAETIEQLRAERDAARMLADVRGSERDALSAKVESLEANAVRMRKYRFDLEGIATDADGMPIREEGPKAPAPGLGRCRQCKHHSLVHGAKGCLYHHGEPGEETAAGGRCACPGYEAP